MELELLTWIGEGTDDGRKKKDRVLLFLDVLWGRQVFLSREGKHDLGTR